jgi:hypothetical protein
MIFNVGISCFSGTLELVVSTFFIRTKYALQYFPFGGFSAKLSDMQMSRIRIAYGCLDRICKNGTIDQEIGFTLRAKHFV